MTYKKFTSGIITLLCILTLSACDNTDTDKSQPDNKSVATTVQNTETILSENQNNQTVNTSKTESTFFSDSVPDSAVITDKAGTSDSDDIVIVEEQVFTSMVQEIYANADNYIGKTIQLTGMFDKYHDEQSNKTYFSVYRKDEMGCCSYGIEVDWDDSTGIQIPAQDQIVTATGVLDKYSENSKDYLVLHLSELKQLNQ